MRRQAIYLAARYSRRLELCVYRSVLQGMGYAVNSRWLDTETSVEWEVETQPVTSAHQSAQRDDIACDDMSDLVAADIVVIFTEPAEAAGAGRGGHHVEFGFVLGINVALAAEGVPRKPIIVCGHRENVFHWLESVAFVSDFDELKTLLTKDLAAGTSSFITDN